MRVLTKNERKEFEKTFDFIDLYIGGAHFLGAKSINEIFFDDENVSAELMKFIKNNFKNLKEVNLLFNNSTKELRKNTLNRLIKYCFNNKVQPSKLRISKYRIYEVKKQNKLAVYELKAA